MARSGMSRSWGRRHDEVVVVDAAVAAEGGDDDDDDDDAGGFLVGFSVWHEGDEQRKTGLSASLFVVEKEWTLCKWNADVLILCNERNSCCVALIYVM